MNKLSKGILESANDPLCVPQLTRDPFRLRGESFAQCWRDYIEFMHSHPEFTNPMDITAIY